MYVAQIERPVRVGRYKHVEYHAEKGQESIMPMYVCCPYYGTDRELTLNCACAKIKFPDEISRAEHMKQFCANDATWKNCHLAKIMTGFYNREDEK